MSRYTGPRLRVIRRLGVSLPGLCQKEPMKQYPPGMHGPGGMRRRGKVSDYAVRLRETQKLRFHYGVREKQLRGVIKRAIRSKQASDEALLVLLESRLDNLIFRSGVARSMRQARQMVSHNHVLLNGVRANVPSMLVKAGDEVTFKENSKWIAQLAKEGAFPAHHMPIPGFVDVTAGPKKLTVTRSPQADEVPLEVDAIFVIERFAGRV